MYFFPEAAVQAVLASGMRAAIGMIAIDFPTAYASDADDYLAKGLALRDDYNPHPLLSFCFAPHAPLYSERPRIRENSYLCRAARFAHPYSSA